MLKEKIASLDEVPEGMREHYGPAEEGDGFQLQIDGAGTLIKALRHERQFRKNAENRERELETQVRHLRDQKGLPPREKMTPREQFLEDAGRRLFGLEGEAKTAEMAKLEQELIPLVDAEVAEHHKQQQQRVERLRGTIQRLTRDNAAREFAMSIRRPNIEPKVLIPLVIDRFHVEEKDGEYLAVPKGANGEPVSLEALADEMRRNPALAPVVAGVTEADKAAHAKKVAETLGLRPNGAAR